MKDTEDDTKKDIPCSWITKINIKCPDTQNNLQIQCNCYQNSNGIFHRHRTNNPKICMEPQKTPNSQNNFEKE